MIQIAGINNITDVDPNAIRQTVSELNLCVESMYNSTNNIQTIFSGLDKNWSGEAKTAFFQLLQSDQKAFYNLISEHRKVNDAISEAMALYQKANDEAIDELSKLKVK